MTTDHTQHLAAETVGAFLDRRLTDGERSSVEAHLADCGVCRREVAEAGRLVMAMNVRRPMVLLPASLAAAAAIAFIALGITRIGRESPDRLRAPTASVETGATPRIGVLAPADGDTVRVRHPVFQWSAVAGAPTYRLTLTDESGETVWTTTTIDTSLTLPVRVVLQGRATYFWYVDALLADGRAVSTGVRTFSMP